MHDSYDSRTRRTIHDTPPIHPLFPSIHRPIHPGRRGGRAQARRPARRLCDGQPTRAAQQCRRRRGAARGLALALTRTRTRTLPLPLPKPNPNPNPSNQVCAALIRWGEAGDEVGEQPALSAGAQAMATYLDAGGLAVPRDLGVLPAEALRALVAAQTEPN